MKYVVHANYFYVFFSISNNMESVFVYHEKGRIALQYLAGGGFPFHQFNLTYYGCCLVPAWRLLSVVPYDIIV